MKFQLNHAWYFPQHTCMPSRCARHVLQAQVCHFSAAAGLAAGPVIHRRGKMLPVVTHALALVLAACVMCSKPAICCTARGVPYAYACSWLTVPDTSLRSAVQANRMGVTQVLTKLLAQTSELSAACRTACMALPRQFMQAGQFACRQLHSWCLLAGTGQSKGSSMQASEPMQRLLLLACCSGQRAGSAVSTARKYM
jgi:hypothetical protein